MNHFTRYKVSLGLLLLLSYALLSMFGILNMAHHMSAPMTHSQQCPYAQGKESLCQATLFDYSIVWQQVTVTFPSLIIVALIAVAFVASFKYHSPPRFLLQIRRAWDTRWKSLYQLLFSQGLLNPKYY